MNEIKKISKKINEDKEKAKLNIQNIFTKIRSVLNEREKELLKEIDEKYDKLFLTEDAIKEKEKLTDKIKISLEKGIKIDKEWDNNKINLMINGCINIENHISDINSINNKFKNHNLDYKNNINFSIDEESINQILKNTLKFKEEQKVEVIQEDEELNEDGLEKEAIETVMNEGKCSRQTAIKALRAHNGDPVEALLDVGN